MLIIALVVGVALGLAVAPASAVKKVAPGHEPFEITCPGLGAITVSVQRSDNRGAVQIVGRKGHLIPVAFTFSAINVTEDEVIFSESETLPGHQNQETITCTGIFFEGPASELELEPGETLPPDVDPTDIVRLVISATVVVKP